MSILQHTKKGNLKGYHYHHIVPKHLGGTDDKSNLILLSVEEHAKAHLELFIKYGKQADAWAYNRLIRQNNLPGSSIYVAPNKGKKFSKEINLKKGRSGELNSMAKKEVKEKHKQSMERLRGSEKLKIFGSKNKSSKKVKINNLEFETIQSAASFYKVGRDTIRGWLNGVKPQSRFAIINIGKT